MLGLFVAQEIRSIPLLQCRDVVFHVERYKAAGHFVAPLIRISQVSIGSTLAVVIGHLSGSLVQKNRMLNELASFTGSWGLSTFIASSVGS